MAWFSLGTVSLNNWDWKFFNLPIVGSTSVFKVKQTFKQGLIYPSGYFHFGFICSNSGKIGIRRIYFDAQLETLFRYELPPEFESTCLVRYAIARLPKKSRVDGKNIPRVELFENL